MNRPLLLLILLILSLSPATGESSYIIHLKNGRQVSTPGYWTVGSYIYFHYPGGIVGFESATIARIETDKREFPAGSREAEPRKIPPPPSGADAKTAKEPAGKPEAAPDKPKLDLREAAQQKDRMISELDNLSDRMRETYQTRDKAARDKIREEMRNLSGRIYELTDQVTEQNQGKLPDGWWQK
jgi:hypothetical protein